MGVKGLWQILAPAGKPVSLESLEGKILAIDVSIWLNKAAKGMRDRGGNQVYNAHLVLMFHRICKLLFYGIKPVFVFDGGVPELKKGTLKARRNRRLNTETSKNKTKDVMLKNYLQAKALEAVTGSKSNIKLKLQDEKEPDLFQLTPLSASSQSDSSASDNEMDKEESWLETLRSDHIQEMFASPDMVDIDSPQFTSLSAEVKHELLTEIKHSKRRRQWGGKNEEIALPEDAGDFSSYQLKNIKHRGKITHQIDSLRREMNCSLSAEFLELYDDEDIKRKAKQIETKRIASNDRARYVLIKKTVKSKEDNILFHSNLDDDYMRFKQREDNFNNEEIYQKLERVPARFETVTSNETVGVKFFSDNSSDEDNGSLLQTINKQDNQSVVTEEENVSMKNDVSTKKVQLEDEVPSNAVEFMSTDSDDSDIEIVEEEMGLTKSTGTSSTVDINNPSHSIVSNDISPTVQNPNTLVNNISVSFKNPTALVDSTFVSIKNPNTLVESTSVTIKNPTALEDSASKTFQNVSTEIQDSSIAQVHNVSLQNTSDEKNVLLETDVAKVDKPIITIDNSELSPLDDAKQDQLSPEAKLNQGNTKLTILSEFRGVEKQIDKNPDFVDQFSKEVKLRNIQENLADEQNQLQKDVQKKTRQAATISSEKYKEVQELLELFGIPYLVSPMEAEAQCAQLDYSNLTDGSVTDDSDIFLFGGKRVFKNVFNQNRFAELYKSEDVEKVLLLTRRMLIALAFLTGSDYTEGVQGIGGVTGMEILHEFSRNDPEETLANLKNWFSKMRQGKNTFVPGSGLSPKLKRAALPRNFNSPAVWEAYLEPMVEKSDERFEWGQPDIEAIKEFANEKFGWLGSRTEEVLLPVITKWSERKKSQKTMDKYFSPKIHLSKTNVESKRIKRIIDLMSNPDDFEEKNHSSTSSTKQGASSSLTSNRVDLAGTSSSSYFSDALDRDKKTRSLAKRKASEMTSSTVSSNDIVQAKKMQNLMKAAEANMKPLPPYVRVKNINSAIRKRLQGRGTFRRKRGGKRTAAALSLLNQVQSFSDAPKPLVSSESDSD